MLLTRGVSDKVAENEAFARFVTKSIKRFMHRDWGDTCEEDIPLNEQALKDGDRILAVYKHQDDTIWIIADAENAVGKREYMTILFPEEY